MLTIPTGRNVISSDTVICLDQNSGKVVVVKLMGAIQCDIAGRIKFGAGSVISLCCEILGVNIVVRIEFSTVVSVAAGRKIVHVNVLTGFDIESRFRVAIKRV